MELYKYTFFVSDYNYKFVSTENQIKVDTEMFFIIRFVNDLIYDWSLHWEKILFHFNLGWYIACLIFLLQ